jgi:predicted ATPase
MIKNLLLKNLTVFPEAQFEFGKNLNVFIGENGTGKSHLLKLLYSIVAVEAQGAKASGLPTPSKNYLQGAIAAKLRNVFKPDELGRLARRLPGRNRCEARCDFFSSENNITFYFNTSSKTDVAIELSPTSWIQQLPVFLPTRELLTIYPGFVSLYETTNLPFEETWRDTCILLGAPLAKGPREKSVRTLLAPLEEIMRGKIELSESGKFYLKTVNGNMEMHLVAEGLRKLGMVARLIATGSLLDKGCLFWDEPEANLNPKIIKLIAKAILDLCQKGIQIFIATHSLFLIKELYILQQSAPSVDCRYFGLHFQEDGVSVIQSNSIDGIGDIASLDEELHQSQRYLNQEFA